MENNGNVCVMADSAGLFAAEGRGDGGSFMTEYFNKISELMKQEIRPLGIASECFLWCNFGVINFPQLSLAL